MKRGSDSGERPSDSGPGARDEPSGREASGDGGVGRLSWWDPGPALADLDPSARRIARALAERVARPSPADGGSEPGVGESPAPADPVPEEAREASPEEAWEAVAALRRSLDRAGGEAPPEELAGARARLDDAAGRLWTAAVASEVRAVREFVGEVAHDFRSPLHSSLFLTDALFREQSGPLTSAQKRQLGIVHSAIAALLRMSDDLLDFSRPEEELAPDDVAEIPFSPRQVVGELEDLLEPMTLHRRASLEIDVADVGSRIGDPQVLNRVLLNFASNALEAVDEGGAVRIRVRADGERLRAVVEDDADDVEPERIRALLAGGDYTEVVRHLEGRTRGLGLVISGRMVRAADGDVTVERTGEGWTRLAVTLPFPPLDRRG